MHPLPCGNCLAGGNRNDNCRVGSVHDSPSGHYRSVHPEECLLISIASRRPSPDAYLASEISKVETSIRILAGNISEMTKENQKNSEQVKSLVAEAQNTRDEVQRLQANTLSSLQQSQQIEKNVAIMQSNVQQTWRSLFESYALAVGTRNMFPPPKEIVDDINKNLNILSRFAYPNPQERRVEVGRILNMIRAAENPAGKKDLSR